MPMPDSRSSQALTELVPIAFRSVPPAVLVNLACAIVVAYVLSDAISSRTLSFWLTGVLLVSVMRIAIWGRFQKIQISNTNVRRWAHFLTIGSGAAGSMWGLAGIVLFVHDNPHLYMFLLFVIGGMATGALAVSGSHMPAFHAFFLTSLPPIGLHFLLSDSEIHGAIAALVAVYALAIFFISLNIKKSFVEIVSLRRHIHAIMENVLDGIITIDTSGRIQSTNQAFANMVGFSETECTGKTFFTDFIPAEYNADAAAEQTVANAPWQSGRAIYPHELVAKRKDGSTFLADIAISNMTYAGEAMRIAIVRDITEQKAMHIQLLQASKLATLGQMAAGIAHELNQPLNVIRMAADNALLRIHSGQPDAKHTEEKLERVSQQAEEMGRIINHLRVFSRLDDERPETFDLKPIVSKSTQLIEDQLNIDNIQSDVQFAKGSFLVKGHPNQLEHVLLNLLSNARDAIIERREILPGAAERDKIDVRVAIDDPDSTVTIRVSDTGAGIAEKDLAKIFDPFFTTKPPGQGTGLGLSITQGIVETMRGHISATNTSTGACFEVKLPRTSGKQPGQIS